MTKSATVTDTGDPMAVPNVWWKNSLLYASYVVLRQKDKRVWISVGESEEHLRAMDHLLGGHQLS